MQSNQAAWLEEIHTAVFLQLFSSVHEIYPNILQMLRGDKDSHSDR